MEQICPRETSMPPAGQETPHLLCNMKVKLCSQGPATGPYFMQSESRPHPHICFLYNLF
jgi:hypothetical protein